LLRIAILHYTAPPVVGGVESTIAHHARRLVWRGYFVRVIAGRGAPFDPQVALHIVPEADSRHPALAAVNAELSQGFVGEAFLTLQAKLESELREALSGIDVCIVHNVLSLHKNLALTAALHTLALTGPTRFIAWCHDFAWTDPLYQPQMRPGHPWDLLRIAWPGVRYVVVSEARREELATLLNCPPAHIAVVPPGVDPVTFLKLSPDAARLVEKLDLLAAAPLMLLPTRLTRRKNIELAIEITAALVQHGLAPRLVVTGPPGPHNPQNVAYLAQLQGLRRERGVEQAVVFLYEYETADPETRKPGNPETGGSGESPCLPLSLSPCQQLYVTDEIIADLYRLADLLLFPSAREGFGIPLLEAGLARLPIFCASIPPFCETAAETAHFFTLDEAPDDIAARIAAFLAQDRVYQMRQRVLRNYTWSRILEEWVVPLLYERPPIADHRGGKHL